MYILYIRERYYLVYHMPCHETGDGGYPIQHGVRGQEKWDCMNKMSQFLQPLKITPQESIQVMQMQMEDSTMVVRQ